MSRPPLPHTSPLFGSTSSWKLLLQGCFPACASPHCSLGMQMLVLPSCPTASPVQAGREGAPAGGWEPGTSPFQPPGKGERAALYTCQEPPRTLPKPSSALAGGGFLLAALGPSAPSECSGKFHPGISACGGGRGEQGMGWWHACPSSRQPESSLLPLLIANAN